MNRFALLFIAPAGSGKTWLVQQIMQQINCKLIFISPLRALANEFYEKVSETTMLYSAGDLIPEGSNVVTTVEQTGPSFWSQIDISNSVFVLDEIHLFYKWGDSFREKLIMFVEDLYSMQASVLLLTATVENSLFYRMKRDLERNYENALIVDRGNMQLKNYPRFYYSLANFKYKVKPLILHHFFTAENSVLVFCKYRQEVEDLAKYFSSFIPHVLSCVGGEVDKFCWELKNTNGKALIISTTCLSHGVNLPKISKIFLTYQVEENAMYLQMLGRGGRKGEVFDIYGFNHQLLIKDKIKSNLRLNLEVLLGKMRVIYESRRNYFKQKFSQIK